MYYEMEHNIFLFQISAYRGLFSLTWDRGGLTTTEQAVIGRKRENVVRATTKIPAMKRTSCIIQDVNVHSGGQDSVISIATHNVLGGLGFEPQWGGRDFCTRPDQPRGPSKFLQN